MRRQGFTLIEILIALAIFAILIMLAAPMYADFMGNSQIRNAAENALTGVRLAQTTAVGNNRPAKFVLDPSPTGGWAVYPFDEASGDFSVVAVGTYNWSEGASRTHVTTLPGGATEITYDGLGRICTKVLCNSTGSDTVPIQQINVTNTSVTTPRVLRVAVSTPDINGTRVGTKLCDPDPGVASTDARACPAS